MRTSFKHLAEIACWLHYRSVYMEKSGLWWNGHLPSRVNLSEGCFVSMCMISQMTKSTSDLCLMKLLGV